MASHKEAIITGEPKVDEYQVFHKNGEIKYFESRVMPVQNHPDKLFVVSIRDVTLRKNMELELERRKKSYQELQNCLKSYSQDLGPLMDQLLGWKYWFWPHRGLHVRTTVLYTIN